MVLDADRRCPDILADLEGAGLVDLTSDVMQDPTYRGTLTRKLRTALRTVGNPAAA